MCCKVVLGITFVASFVFLCGNVPDMDTIYSAAEEMRGFADRLNHFADQLMIEYRKMDHHQHMIELDDLESESYAH